MSDGYLARLMIGLTVGAAQLDSSTRDRHLQFVLRLQREDGGWAGREGASDLYYTSFALRVLAMFGKLNGQLAERCSQYIQSQLISSQSIVDLLSLIYSAKLIEAACDLDPMQGCQQDWPAKLAEMLHTLRRDDGGFARSADGHIGSTYNTFLSLICLELIGAVLPQPDSVADFLIKQRQDDGGFLEIRVAKRSGVNPTAAAIGGLRVLNRIDSHTASNAAEFLLESQSDDGGFQANSRIPVPDLLSTFTSLVTLADLEALERANLVAIHRYIRSMELVEGGFRGFEFDQGTDVEYTFYGLGSLAILQLCGVNDSIASILD